MIMFAEAQDPTQKQERRLSLRVPIRILKINTDKNGREIFFGYATNISSNGMYIQTSNPRDIGAKFAIAFDLPKKKIKISCDAEVAWVQNYDPTTKTTPGMGIRFLDLPSKDQKEIDDFIQNNS